jgi:TATA-binding protein-associated factor
MHRRANDVCFLFQLLSCVDHLLACLEHRYTAVRHMAGRCLGMLSRLLTAEVMERVVRRVVPLLGSSDNECRRQGAIESIARMCLFIYLFIYSFSRIIVQ